MTNSKWIHLIEGKAISPTPQMIKLSKHIATRIGEILAKSISKYVKYPKSKDDTIISKYNKRVVGKAGKTGEITWELNKDSTITDVIVDGGKYGKFTVDISYVFRPVSGFALITNPVENGLVDYTLEIVFGIEDVLMLSAPELPILGRYFKKQLSDISFSSRVKSRLYDGLVHEFTHIIDPKTSPEFIRKHVVGRTRKPISYETWTDTATLMQAGMDKYITNVLEQETWPRDVARLVINVAYSKRYSLQDVAKVVRSPKVLNHSRLKIPGSALNAMDVLKNNPKAWRRFLLTLNDEYKIFLKNPSAHVSMYIQPTANELKQDAKRDKQAIRANKMKEKLTTFFKKMKKFRS